MTSPRAPLYGAKYPLRSRIRSVASVAKTSMDPLAPSGTMAALATTCPFQEFSVDTRGCVVSAISRDTRAKFDPTNLKDAFEEKLREFIQKRANTAIPAYERGETPKRAPVLNIMEALRKSLEMARKP